MIGAVSSAMPVAPAAEANILRVDRNRMASLIRPGGGWRDSRIPVAGGDAVFRIGAIADGLSLTRSICRPGASMRSVVEHGGSLAILAFGLEGGSLFGLEGRSPDHVVQAGDVWLFRAEDAAMLRHTPRQTRTVMAALKVDLRRIAPVLADLDGSVAGRGSGVWRLGRGQGACRLLRDLLEVPLASGVDRLQAESMALSLLARWLAPASDMPDVPAGPLSARERAAVARVVEVLAADLADPPSLEELATLAGMSHVRLNRCFRKLWGKTVFAWLRDHRLEVAGRHMAEDKLSVTEIAFLCGFSSSSHFAAAFRTRYGCAPLTYRQQDRH